jgi:putative acyl-CoA dehydrogenase
MSDTLEHRRSTHEVLNQVPPFEDVNLYDTDVPLQEAAAREGAGWAVDRLRDTGAVAGSAEAQEHGRRADRNGPRLVTHDRHGHRVDLVDYDPSWHWLLRGAVEREIHALPWRDPRPGAHVARAGLELLWSQVNAGVICPVSMTYSGVPALRHDAAIAAEWEPRLTLPDYERGALCGMAMTEKQGGSDVRARDDAGRRARGDGCGSSPGHKWFCSHPMCDVFLVLAQAPAGLSCFVVERGPGHGAPAPQGQARDALAGVLGGRVPRGARPAARGGGPRRGDDHRHGHPHAPGLRHRDRRRHAPRGRRGGGTPATAGRSARGWPTSR